MTKRLVHQPYHSPLTYTSARQTLTCTPRPHGNESSFLLVHPSTCFCFPSQLVFILLPSSPHSHFSLIQPPTYPPVNSALPCVSDVSMSELSNNTTPTTDVMDLTHLSSNMECVNEDQASSPSPHQHSDKDVFPFFRLPRELRDNIYDLALVPESDFTIQNPRPQRWGPPMSQEAFTPTNATTPAMATTSGVPAWFTNEYAQDNVPVFPHADIRPPPGAFPSPFLSYDELVRLRPSLHASVNFRANVNLLLTNKTVKNEYEARAKLALTLVCSPHLPPSPTLT